MIDCCLMASDQLIEWVNDCCLMPSEQLINHSLTLSIAHFALNYNQSFTYSINWSLGIKQQSIIHLLALNNNQSFNLLNAKWAIDRVSEWLIVV
jgi:hypothetical protein